jgi:hypothetical protein
MRALSAIAALALLSACAGGIELSQSDLKAAWEARNVEPVTYKADIIAFMRTYLNDPTNVRNAGITAPVRKTMPGDPAERFVSCLRYSAKSSSGQYGATKTGAVVYAGGRLDRFIDTPVIVREVCKDAAFSPYPELQNIKR